MFHLHLHYSGNFSKCPHLRYSPLKHPVGGYVDPAVERGLLEMFVKQLKLSSCLLNLLSS